MNFRKIITLSLIALLLLISACAHPTRIIKYPSGKEVTIIDKEGQKRETFLRNLLSDITKALIQIGLTKWTKD